MGLTLALVSPSFRPMIGGVELYVYNLGKELAKRGHEVHVLTPDSVLGRKLGPPQEVVDGIYIHRIHTVFDFSYRVRLWPALRSEIIRLAPDLVHVYSHDSYAWFARSACKELGIPMLLTTYGPFRGQSEGGRLSALLLGAYDSWIAPRLVRDASSINVRYPELKSWLSELGFPSDLVTVEPSCIPSEYLEPGSPSEFRRKNRVDARFVLYVGRLSKQKGIHNLMASAKFVHGMMPDIEFVLVGPNYSNTDLGMLPSWIHVLPPPSSVVEERDLFASCDTFVMPSKFEGFSQAVLKALAQGRKIIATDVGGLPFELGYGRYGRLVPYGDVDTLASTIMRSLTDVPARSDELRNYASSFVFEKAASRLEYQYGNLCKGSAS